jgi:hypothetical protein
LRSSLISLLLWLSFLTACLFYGVQENVIVLCLSIGLMLAAAILSPWRRVMARFSRKTIDGWLCLWSLGCLVISYSFVTISPESSFAVTWILACLPLWYLVISALPDRRLLHWLLIGTVLVFALLSALRFVVSGQLAFEPLTDPNNYASLLYLAWIPLAHRLLLGEWRDTLQPNQRLFAHIMLMILALALFATSSRVGLAVVCAALAGWLFLLTFRRLAIKPWLVLVVSTAIVYSLVLLLQPQLASGAFNSSEFGAGVSIRGALYSSAWQMFLDAPLLGTGIFTFSLLYPLYRQLGDQSTAGLLVHNDYLQLALESGPWLILPLLVVAIAVTRLLWRSLFSKSQTDLNKYGLAMTAAALLVHASVNFVFYVLPLIMMLAVVFAELFAVQDGKAPVSAAGESTARLSTSRPVAWVTGLAFGVFAWFYLALDVAISAVFAGQPVINTVREMRTDSESLLVFARRAQVLNDRRSTPVLAEAMLLTRMYAKQGETAVSKAEILARYRHALRLDPLNPMVYEQFFQFLNRFADAELAASLRREEIPQALLLRAVQLDVRRTGTIFELLAFYDRLGLSEQALAVVKNDVFPWVERVQWHHPEDAQRLIGEMRRRAEDLEDEEFLRALEARSTEVSRFSPRLFDYRLRDWMREVIG